MSEKVRRALENKMKGVIPIQCFIATVSSVDENKSCCDVVRVDDDAEIPNVRFKPTIDNDKKGIIAVPAQDSFVIVGKLGNKTNSCFIIWCSNIVKYIIADDNGNTFEMKDDGTMLLNGDDYKGLVKLQELKDNLDAIKQYLNSLNTAIQTGLSSVGVGTSANGGSGASAFQTAVSALEITFKDMESNKVKHGKGV